MNGRSRCGHCKYKNELLPGWVGKVWHLIKPNCSYKTFSKILLSGFVIGIVVGTLGGYELLYKHIVNYKENSLCKDLQEKDREISLMNDELERFRTGTNTLDVFSGCFDSSNYIHIARSEFEWKCDLRDVTIKRQLEEVARLTTQMLESINKDSQILEQRFKNNEVRLLADVITSMGAVFAFKAHFTEHVIGNANSVLFKNVSNDRRSLELIMKEDFKSLNNARAIANSILNMRSSEPDVLKNKARVIFDHINSCGKNH